MAFTPITTFEEPSCRRRNPDRSGSPAGALAICTPSFLAIRSFTLTVVRCTYSAGDGESATATNLAEIKANLFAAELLMPLTFVIVDVEHQPSVDLADDNALRDMAKRYKVSPQSMAFRLANLGLLCL